MTETERDIRIKRLIYRSWHRGCKETDVILGYFANNHARDLSDDELTLFEALMDEFDADIWKWLTGKEQPTNDAYRPLLDKLREYSDSHAHTQHLKQSASASS